MHAKITAPIPARPPPSPLLISQFCTANFTTSNLDPRTLSLRATHTTILLAGILAQSRHRHFGIND